MSFGAPDLVWLLLAAPVAGGLAAWLWRRRLEAERQWSAEALWAALGRRHRAAVRRLGVLLLTVAVAATTLALMRPRWGGESDRIERRGIDLVFILDTSLSMAAGDVRPDRLAVATALLRRIARAQPGSRVALVQAEGDAVVLTPLTLDAAVLDLLLETTRPGLAPAPGTRLAPALDAARRLFPPASRGHRAIVLLSDGEDHAGGLEDRAEQLRAAGIRLFAIGIGTEQGAPLPLADDEREEFKRDEEGRVVISRLQEDPLEELARRTGGVYLRATSPATDLEPVLDALRTIQARTLEEAVTSAQAERFQWPLALAALALGLLLALRVDVPAGRMR